MFFVLVIFYIDVPTEHPENKKNKNCLKNVSPTQLFLLQNKNSFDQTEQHKFTNMTAKAQFEGKHDL